MLSNVAVIILAAGAGKRMKSNLPKVLHEVSGRPILLKTLEAINKIEPKQTIIVASPSGVDSIKKAAGENYAYAVQEEPHGTADAARTGLKEVAGGVEKVAVMYGDDTAFYKPETLIKALEHHDKTGATITFITLKKVPPTGFGRIVRQNGKVAAIVEEKDASSDQKKIKEINDGFYVFERTWIERNLPKLSPSKATGELYITDLIEIALKQKQPVETYNLEDPNQWHGINTKEELKEARLKSIKKIHIMGAAGAGAAAVAGIAKKTGFVVSGCDLSPKSAYSENLEIKILKGHSKSHLENVDALIMSPAIEKLNPKNAEIKAAKEKNIPVMTWQEFQGKILQKNKFVITVAGAYGKSTTTAMISKILQDSGLDPTCEVGAKILEWNANFRFGRSKYYVCESDEYNDNFLNYSPDIAVILNIDWDHPDFFKTQKQLAASYKKFVSRIKDGGVLIIANDPKLKEIAKSAHSSVKIVTIKQIQDLNLSIIGNFRKQNASAALSVAEALSINTKSARASVQSFKGLGRRLEYKGKVKSVEVYDDYAVQPYTIRKTSDALVEKFPNKKVSLVLEPHTFSRINTFFDNFVRSLKSSKVHQILITEVYAAREKGDKIALSSKLARTIGDKAKFTGSVKETALFIKKNLKNYDIILSMGAGNSYKLYDLLKK